MNTVIHNAQIGVTSGNQTGHRQTQKIPILSHFSFFRRFWEYLIFVVSFFTPIELTFNLCFAKDFNIKKYSFFSIFDFLQIVDLYIIAKTPFLKDGVLVYDTKSIITNYRKPYFIVSCIAAIPLGWIGLLLKNRLIYGLLSINRFFRLYRFWIAFKTITNTSMYLSPLSKIFPPFVLYFFLIHIWACIFFSIALKEGLENSWIKPYAHLSHEKLYIVSFYYVFTTFTTVGYGYMHPNNTVLEQMFSILLQLTGATVVTLLLSSMVANLIDEYKSEYLLDYRMLQQFFKFQKIDREIVDEVNNYYQDTWEKRHGYFGWSGLLSELPDGLSRRMKLDFCNKVFTCMKLFENVPENFLLSMADILEPALFAPKERLFSQGDPADKVIIFNSGVIKIGMNGTEFAKREINEPSVEGERYLIFDGGRKITVEAISIVDTFIFTKERFYKLCGENHEVCVTILNNAQELYSSYFIHKDFPINSFWDDQNM